MLTGLWPSPAGYDEYALSFDRQREKRLLVVPALFGESNKLRRFTVEMMRELDASGVDCFLPDLPGTNESLDWPSEQTLTKWRDAMDSASRHFGATNVLAIRGGSLAVTTNLPTAHYAPVSGAWVLRGLMRAHLLQMREAGKQLTMEGELSIGRAEGLIMVGYDCSPQLIMDLEEATAGNAELKIEQTSLGGPGLWLRAEPAEHRQQSEKLSEIVQEWLTRPAASFSLIAKVRTCAARSTSLMAKSAC